MTTIILKKLYPKGLDLRQQVRWLTETVRKISLVDEPVFIDVNDACISRSAMDEFYKSFVRPESDLAKFVTITNRDEDFELKLKAVIKSQGVRKHLRRFPRDRVIIVKDAAEIKRFVEQIRA